MCIRNKSGDTFVEVAFAIAIFSLIAIISIVAMNSSIATAQATLEVTMARNEIDAQAEAIRFIHNSYLSERELVDSQQRYRNLWKRLTDTNQGGLSNNSGAVPDLNYTDCATPYDASSHNSLFNTKAFILDTRSINPDDETFYTNEADRLRGIIVGYREQSSKFGATTLYPRIIYTTVGGLGTGSSDDTISGENYRYVGRAEGIWVVSIAGVSGQVYSSIPEYYDFHIRTCWYAPGRNTPSTIGTIIRLYNPELVEIAR